MPHLQQEFSFLSACFTIRCGEVLEIAIVNVLLSAGCGCEK